LPLLAHRVSLSHDSSIERSQDVEVADDNVKNYVYMIDNFTESLLNISRLGATSPGVTVA